MLTFIYISRVHNGAMEVYKMLFNTSNPYHKIYKKKKKMGPNDIPQFRTIKKMYFLDNKTIYLLTYNQESPFIRMKVIQDFISRKIIASLLWIWHPYIKLQLDIIEICFFFCLDFMAWFYNSSCLKHLPCCPVIAL